MSLTRASYALALLAYLVSPSAAVVVVNDNIGFGGPHGGSTPTNTDEYGIGIAQDAEDSTGTGANFHFNYFDYTITGSLFLADEGVDAYLVHEGDNFNRQTIASGQFPIIWQLSNTNPVFNTVALGNDYFFYLGLATHLGGEVYEPEARNVFGWVKLRFDEVSNRFLIMESNAVAYDERGIIVGTAQLAPEPSTLFLAVALTGFLGLARRRRFGN
jgi:hypothetical protein